MKEKFIKVCKDAVLLFTCGFLIGLGCVCANVLFWEIQSLFY